MTKGRGQRIGLAAAFFLLFMVGIFRQPQTAFAALTANVTDNSTVQLDWAGTGSGPYVLYRGGTQIYSGSDTRYIDSALRYSTGYNYTLNYQNYEQIGGGYYRTRSVWGIVRNGYSYTREEWQIVEPGHYERTEIQESWCVGRSDSGITYEHKTPCVKDENETTRLITRLVWVPDRYGYVTVTYYVPPEYGWINETYWVSPEYGYVTRTTSVTSGPVMGTSPGLAILSPTNGQWLADSFVPRISVSDRDGDTLTSTYTIDGESAVRESRTISNTATAQEVAFSRLSVDGLSEGRHILKVAVTDNYYNPVVQTVEFYVDKSGPVIGNIQSSSTYGNITVAGSATDSGVGLAETPYRYTIGNSRSEWTANPYTFYQLSPDTAYPVTVEARDKLERISAKQQVVYTKAQTPAVSVIQSAESTLGIKIGDSNPSATRYQIKVGNQYIDAAGNLTASPVPITLINKQTTVNGLIAGTTYNLQASAINQEGTATNWSGVVAGTTLAYPPANIAATRTQTSITLNWPAVWGVSAYDVEADGIFMANVTAVSYTHTGLSPDTRHTYRVRTVNAGGIGKWSAERQVFTLPNPPETPTDIVPAYEQTYVTLNWNAAARAESYEVEADGKVMDAGSGTTFTHSGLQPETPHVYRVRAKNIGGISGWSEPITVTTWPDPPPTPENVAAQPSIRSVTVTWDAAERATGYEIEADGFLIDTGNQTQYTDNGLEPVTGHTYRVRAKNIGGKSAWSPPIDIMTHPEIPTAPTNLMATSEQSSITVTWYKVPYTDSYDVEIDGANIVNVTDNQFVHPDLGPDSRHTYRVRAKNISGDSEWSSPVTMATLPSGPNSALSLTNIAAIVTNTFITISWDTVAPNAQYDVEVDGVMMDNGSNTIYNHTGLAAGEFHTYRIRVKDQERIGDWVAVLSLSTLPDPPDAPTNIQAFPTTNSIELRWEKVDGATGYDLEIDGKTVSVGAEATYLHPDLAPGTAYTYRVRAKNVTGVTAWSPSIVQSTNSPSYLVNGTRGAEFDLSLFAYNVQDFSELTYVVTYNPNEMDVVDLYQFTPQADVSGGKIPGSPLEAAYTPGRITFKANRNVVPGTSWSGEIASVVFKSKVTGQMTIDAFVE